MTTSSARLPKTLRHPNVFWRHWGDPLGAGFEQVGVTIEAVKTVGCLVVCPLGPNQQTMLGQYLKQTISPDLDLPV